MAIDEKSPVAAASDTPSEEACLNCGACCAYFRVSFYWADATTHGVPMEFVRQINPWMACMAGTENRPVRCAALTGTTGEKVACSIYEQRPQPCRSVQVGDEKCNRARGHYGLPPIETNCAH